MKLVGCERQPCWCEEAQLLDVRATNGIGALSIASDPCSVDACMLPNTSPTSLQFILHPLVHSLLPAHWLLPRGSELPLKKLTWFCGRMGQMEEWRAPFGFNLGCEGSGDIKILEGGGGLHSTHARSRKQGGVGKWHPHGEPYQHGTGAPHI